MVTKYPEALSKPSAGGQLPFHRAMFSGSIGIEGLNLMYNAHRQGLFADIVYGVQTAAFETVISWLVEKNPLAMQAANNEGDLPLHLVTEHDSCSVSSLKLLSEKFPRALQMQNSYGNLPLHFAVRNGKGVNRLGIVQFLLDQYPGAAYRTNGAGGLPLHVACANNAPLAVIDLLVQNNPGGLAVYDSKGRLPFHWACICGNDVTLIEHLIKKHQDSTLPSAKEGATPLFLACEKDVKLDVILLLVQNSRELFSGDFHSSISGSTTKPTCARNLRKRIYPSSDETCSLTAPQKVAKVPRSMGNRLANSLGTSRISSAWKHPLLSCLGPAAACMVQSNGDKVAGGVLSLERSL